MAEIEAKVNQIIWENQEVEIFYPTEEELKNLDYRSKKELSGWVRIVLLSRSRYLRMLRNSCDAYWRNWNGEVAFCGEIP